MQIRQSHGQVGAVTKLQSVPSGIIREKTMTTKYIFDNLVAFIQGLVGSPSMDAKMNIFEKFKKEGQGAHNELRTKSKKAKDLDQPKINGIAFKKVFKN